MCEGGIGLRHYFTVRLYASKEECENNENVEGELTGKVRYLDYNRDIHTHFKVFNNQ